MKTEHRHELETNDLAQKLAVWIEGIKPYTTYILLGIGLLLGGYLAGSYWSAKQAQQEQEFWQAYQTALTTSDSTPAFQDYSEVRKAAASEDYTAAGQQWAYLTWADRQLLVASTNYLSQREKAKETLTSIFGVYDQLATTASDQNVRNRAQLGLARVHEMQNEPEKAQKAYAAVRGIYETVAQQRLAMLNSETNQAAIDWLATTELPKPDPLGGGIPGVRPGFAAEIPETEAAEQPEITKGSIEELLGKVNEDEDDENRYEGSSEENDDSETADEASGEQDAEPESDAEDPQ